ncbi:hypothetical protein J4205_01815 [Candidatus Pacearchaeota archaeon]|nr:hypothetical protein [uncultured archaeon]MBS3066537.1 hypothetical protein [Candidatus Pacearchaeota archaeon]
MRKLFILGIFLLLVGSVYAAEVNINIETLPDHTLIVSALDGDAVYNLLDSKKVNSDSSGKAEITLTVNTNVIDLGVTLSKDGSKILYNRFEDYNINSPISLKIMPGGYIGDAASDPALLTNNANTTEPNSSNDSEVLVPLENDSTLVNGDSVDAEISSNDTNNRKFTGFSINKTGEILKKNWYYPVGAVLLLVVILVVFLGMRSMPMKKQEVVNNPDKPIVYKKYYDFEKEEDQEDPRIKSAEDKIAQAQKELKMIKNEEEIKKAEQKLKDDQDRLERLRKGGF